MEREANYAAVGAFVLLVALGAALFVYWYSDTREHRSSNRYEIYFDGSVSGLEKGGAVRYLGVGVGRVVDMRIDSRDRQRVRVQVIVDIDSSTPITQRTVAELQLQGVTGLLYIDLLEGDGEGVTSAPMASLKYPVIRSTPSRFDAFLANLPEVETAAAEVVKRVNHLLNDENLEAITVSLANVQKAGGELPQTMHDVSMLVADLRRATAELGASAKAARSTLNTVGPELQGTVQRFTTVADNLTRATDQLDQTITENRGDLRTFIHTGLPEVERFLREGRDAAQQIKELSASLRQNPSQLLYEPTREGVEIPR
jgi:phospholipid/cholesterol/gamma-HCH transport system substrate-binding protein